MPPKPKAPEVTPPKENNEQPKAPEVTPEETKPGVLKLVKIEDGKVIDRTTMPKASYDLLPPHKYGWTIEKPAELQS